MDKKEGTTESYKEALSTVRRRLARARYDCIDAIENEIEKGGIGIVLTNDDFGKISAKVNEVVGCSLRDVLQSIWAYEYGENWLQDTKEPSFYFAPGYCQYKLYEKNAELTAKRPDVAIDKDTSVNDEPGEIIQRMSENEKYKQYGVGFKWNENRIDKFYCFRLNVWMLQFYEKRINHHVLYGFTKWFEFYKQELKELKEVKRKSRNLRLSQNDNLSGSDSLVAIMMKAVSKPTKPSKKDGVLTIPVSSRNAPIELMKEIKSALEQRTNWPNDSRPKHSLPLFGYKGGEPVEYIKQNTSDDNYKMTLEMMSILFGLLCNSIFNKQDNSTYAMLKNIVKKSSKLKFNRDVSKRIENTVVTIKKLSRNNKSNGWYDADVVFKYYYAIPLDDSLDVEKYTVKGNMGTANLYSTLEIPSDFLFLIKSWLSEIYSQVRLCEALIAAGTKGLSVGQDDIITAFSHEIDNVISMIKDTCLTQITDVLKLEHIKIAQFKRKWIPENNIVESLIDNEEMYREVMEWSICPVPASFKTFNDLLTMWGTSRSPINGLDIRAGSTIGEILDKIYPIALQIACLKRNLTKFTVDGWDSIIKLNTMIKEDKKLFEGRINLDKLQRNIKTKDNSLKSNDPKVFFIRCLGAMLINALYHAGTSGNVCIYGNYHEMTNSYTFGVTNEKIDNEYNKSNQGLPVMNKSFLEGTKGVIDALTKRFEGRLTIFGHPGSKNDQWTSEIFFVLGDLFEVSYAS